MRKNDLDEGRSCMVEPSDKRKYDVLWDQLEISPSVQLKFGIKRKVFPLTKKFSSDRSKLTYVNQYVELTGKWDNSPAFGSRLSLKIKNTSKELIKICRLVFPTENGLDDFLSTFKYKDISFFRNGYQSWSTTRSYRLIDKPLRPWLQIVSLTSSNMSNLPSNTPGNLSSEMYSVITNTENNESFLVGQSSPFSYLFYIRMISYMMDRKKSHFELVFDFGRKMLGPGKSITLDPIVMGKGETINLQRAYFDYVGNKVKTRKFKQNLKGWSTWYYYFDKISPGVIYENVEAIKKYDLPIDLIQVDDGYQTFVGDWLDLKKPFEGEMKRIADFIKSHGFEAGLWIAPFIVDPKSKLAQNYPNYILRNDNGKRILDGYNPMWPGKFYYSLDITNPRVEEYIRKVIRTIVHEWGFTYLKLDFLFGASMRGGNHAEMQLSRSEVLRKGIDIIRDEAGSKVILAGCGMPISGGIGTVDIMRVGPDTAPFWRKWLGSFFQTGAMLGARNSIRNFMARSYMHKKIWLNDPDCLMLRKTKTKLTLDERRSQINAIIISGGILMTSDNFTELGEGIIDELRMIIELNEECFKGDAIPLDQMDREMPFFYYNTAGFLGVFNFCRKKMDVTLDTGKYDFFKGKPLKLTEVWTNETYTAEAGSSLIFPAMKRHSSYLFKIE